jgi:hypothetical protein
MGCPRSAAGRRHRRGAAPPARTGRVDPFAAELGSVVATLREFVLRAEALRTVLLLDRGEESAALVIDLDAAGELEVAEGDDVRAVSLDDFATAAPLELPPVHPLPAIEVDPIAGQLTAPLGTVERTADGVRATARLFGERSVLTAAFPTNDPDEPLFIAARGEEPFVLSLGGQEWELP